MMRLAFTAAIFLLLALATVAQAMDQVMLKSGARVSGTILAQSKDRVIMRVGEGNAVYSKKAIWRIYEDITAFKQNEFELEKHRYHLEALVRQNRGQARA